MPSKQEKDAVVSRLRALFDVISEEVANNPDFFMKIQEIVLSPEALVAAKQKPLSPTRPPALNLLEILHQDGPGAAKTSLEKLTNVELAALAVADGTKKPKEAKNMDRDALIELLLQTAEGRLRQGESFIKSQKLDESK